MLDPVLHTPIFILSLALCAGILMFRRNLLNLTAKRDDLAAVQSAHVTPTPRVGGLAIFAALGAGAFLCPPDMRAVYLGMLLSLTPVFLAGLAEDFGYNIRPRYRLLAAALSSGVAIAVFGVWVARSDVPGLDLLFAVAPFAILFTVFATAGVSNAFNLIDGMNGLSSGAAIMTALGLGAMAMKTGEADVAYLSTALVAGIAGFFLFNFPFGKIFLGDAGAYSIGHVLAWTSILLMARNADLSTFAVLLVFFWPIADTVFAIVRRASAGQPTDQPDRLHYHQFVMRALEIMVLGRGRRHIANPLTSLILWPLAALPILCGVLFWNNAVVALALLVLFGAGFVISYRMGMGYARTHPRQSALLSQPVGRINPAIKVATEQQAA